MATWLCVTATVTQSSLLALVICCAAAVVSGAGAGGEVVYRNVTLHAGSFIIALEIPVASHATSSDDSPGHLPPRDTEVTDYVPPRLAVVDSSTGAVLWSSVDNVTFLVAGKGTFSARQNSGYFVVDNDVKDVCGTLDILSWTSTDRVDVSSTRQQQQNDHAAESSRPRDSRRRGDTGAGVSTVVLLGTLCAVHPVEISFRAVAVAGHEQLVVSARLVGPSHYTHLTLSYSRDAREQFYGFGHQYTEFDLSGRKFPVFSSEQGVGRGREPLTTVLNTLSPGSGGHWYTSYTHVPFYVTSSRRALLLESPEYVEFNIESSDHVAVELVATNLTFRLFGGCSNIPELLTSYTAYTGRMAQDNSASSTHSAVLGLEGGTVAVLNRTTTICAKAAKLWPGKDCPVSALWLQDWTGERNFTAAGSMQRVGLWWVWELDRTHYPGFEEFVAALKTIGIGMLIYFNPMITDIKQRGTPYVRDYYAEGVEKGYFVRDKDDKVWVGYSKASLVDLTNPAAAAWMQGIITSVLLETGSVGHMNDFGECLPLDGHLYRGDGFVLHNQYPTMWAKLNKRAVDECKAKTSEEYMYFMRSAGVFTSPYTSQYWMGDQIVTWDDYDGMKSAIVAMLSAGMSGHSLVHTDIGGYADIDIADVKFLRSKELLMRWSELAVFTSMFRSHLGTLPNTWQIDSDVETLEHFLRMAVLFKGLQGYRDQLHEDARNFGWPMVRHMVFEFWDNEPLRDAGIRYEQFMFGPSILVAPVSDPGKTAVSVWLPLGTKWTNAKNDTSYVGRNTHVSIPAPIGQPCFLFRQPIPEKPWVGELLEAVLRLGFD